MPVRHYDRMRGRRVGDAFETVWSDAVVRHVEHGMNVIVAPVAEHVPLGLLPPSVLARGTAILFRQFDVDPCGHSFGIADVSLEHLACAGCTAVGRVDPCKRILLLLLILMRHGHGVCAQRQ